MELLLPLLHKHFPKVPNPHVRGNVIRFILDFLLYFLDLHDHC